MNLGGDCGEGEGGAWISDSFGGGDKVFLVGEKTWKVAVGRAGFWAVCARGETGRRARFRF